LCHHPAVRHPAHHHHLALHRHLALRHHLALHDYLALFSHLAEVPKGHLEHPRLWVPQECRNNPLLLLLLQLSEGIQPRFNHRPQI
jgi:hypothetical protein